MKEILFFVGFLCYVAFWGSAGYVIMHFLLKYW